MPNNHIRPLSTYQPYKRHLQPIRALLLILVLSGCKNVVKYSDLVSLTANINTDNQLVLECQYMMGSYAGIVDYHVVDKTIDNHSEFYISFLQGTLENISQDITYLSVGKLRILVSNVIFDPKKDKVFYKDTSGLHLIRIDYP